jgi:hypothetical protein
VHGIFLSNFDYVILDTEERSSMDLDIYETNEVLKVLSKPILCRSIETIVFLRDGVPTKEEVPIKTETRWEVRVMIKNSRDETVHGFVRPESEDEALEIKEGSKVRPRDWYPAPHPA